MRFVGVTATASTPVVHHRPDKRSTVEKQGSSGVTASVPKPLASCQRETCLQAGYWGWQLYGAFPCRGFSLS